ncbi:hypothetical protein WDU94_005797 [Cyamophila willieti]
MRHYKGNFVDPLVVTKEALDSISDQSADTGSNSQAIYNILLRTEKKVDSLIQGGVSTNSNDVLSLLPIQTMDQFQAFENDLSNDTNMRATLENILTYVGGDGPRFFIFNCMKTLLGQDLAEKTSLSGKSGLEKRFEKLKFDGTQCYHIIKKLAMEQKLGTPNIRTAISDWLNQAKSRRVRKETRKQAERN